MKSYEYVTVVAISKHETQFEYCNGQCNPGRMQSQATLTDHICNNDIAVGSIMKLETITEDTNLEVSLLILCDKVEKIVYLVKAKGTFYGLISADDANITITSIKRKLRSKHRDFTQQVDTIRILTMMMKTHLGKSWRVQLYRPKHNPMLLKVVEDNISEFYHNCLKAANLPFDDHVISLIMQKVAGLMYKDFMEITI